MVQRVYRQITTVDADAKIMIATSKSQASAIKNQLDEKASIFQLLMCLNGYGEVQTMDADQKPMRFSKGETLFLLPSCPSLQSN